jgi:hypothetical protein
LQQPLQAAGKMGALASEGDRSQAAMLDLQRTEQGKTSSARIAPNNDELTEIH